MNCVICGRSVEPEKAKTYELTEGERRILRTLLEGGDQAPTYCPACDRVMRDPQQAAQLMKGLFMTMSRKSGVPMVLAEKQADKVYQFYLSKALSKARKPKS